MRRTLVASVALAVGLAVLMGYNASSPDMPSSPATSPQGALVNLALTAGYEIAGIPSYEVMRWTTHVSIPGCTVYIAIDGNAAPAAENPTSFTVISIGGVDFATSNPGINATNLSAASLKAIDGMKETLNCGG